LSVQILKAHKERR